MKIKTGLCSVTFRKLDAFEVLEIGANAGIEGIEWGADFHVPVGDYDQARRIKDLSEKKGVNSISYGSYLRFGETLDRPEEVIETAITLGAKNIRVWPGISGLSSKDYSKTQKNIVIKDLKEFCNKSLERNLMVSLEYHPQTLTDHLESALDLLDQLTNENLFTYWQSYPGINQTTCLNELDSLAERLSHLHIFQWDAERKRYPLSEGSEVWSKRLEQIKPNKNWLLDRYAFIEFVANDSVNQFIDDAAELKKMINAI